MQEIIAAYLENYLPRKDIIHRLPVSLPIAKAWPEIQKARKARSQELPLRAANGSPFWWVLTDSIVAQSEDVLALARRELEFEAVYRDALLDEAVFSSIIEGAFTTKKDAREFIEKGRTPKNKSEQMVKNNYEALTYVLEHIDAPITEQIVFDIYALVTKDTLEEDYSTDRYATLPAELNSKRSPFTEAYLIESN